MQELGGVPNPVKKTFVPLKSLRNLVSVESELHPRSYMDSVPWLEQQFLHLAQKERINRPGSLERETSQMLLFQVKPDCKDKREKGRAKKTIPKPQKKGLKLLPAANKGR